MDTPSQSQVLRLLAIAVVLGVLSAAGGSILLGLVNKGQEFFFVDLPDHLGPDFTSTTR